MLSKCRALWRAIPLMPTVAELVHWGAPLGLAVLKSAGGASMARDVARVVRLSPDRPDRALYGGDLVLVSVTEWASIPGLVAYLGAAPIAGTLVADAGDHNPFRGAGAGTAPILESPRDLRIERIEQRVASWLAERQILDERLSTDLATEFTDFVCAGATVKEVVIHLACLTGKLALLHDSAGAVCVAYQPGCDAMSERTLRRAMRSLPRGNTRDGTSRQGGVATVELAAPGLFRLTVAICPANPVGLYISLLADPATVTKRDNIALASAARALSGGSEGLGVDGREWLGDTATCQINRSYFALAVDIPSWSHADELRARLVQLMGTRQLLLRLEATCFVCAVTVGEPALQDWERHDLARCWHGSLSKDFGPISLGYSSVHTGQVGLRRAVLEARRALVSGNRVSGPGQPHAFSDVTLRNFVLRWHEPADLQALHDTFLGPIVAHDRVAEQQLLPTLAAYLDSACVTLHAAERLGVHRNSVTYRLKQIETLAQVDLGDADTRLILQFALRANRAIADSAQMH